MENFKIIAHRGANKEALENTFLAFDKAVQGGAHRIELDVHLTKDKVPVVLHDDNLFRSTGKRLFLKDLTISDLENIHLANGEDIPTLSEVMERYLSKIEL